MKNNYPIPAYDIDELVAAYPHQEFLQASAERAWRRLQHKKKRNVTQILLRRWVTAAAVVALVMVPWSLLREDPIQPAGKMEGNFRVVRLKDDPTKQPPTKGKWNPVEKVKPVPAPLHQPLAMNHSPLSINHSPLAAVKPRPIQPVQPPTLVNGLADSAPTHPQEPTILLAGFNTPDSIIPGPATRTQKKIPPSINELFDGIQKLSNRKRKAVSSTDPHNIWKTASPSASPDTLFPKSFN